jgi:cobalt-zinc-cadmium efflux system outer membrane protein
MMPKQLLYILVVLALIHAAPFRAAAQPSGQALPTIGDAPGGVGTAANQTFQSLSGSDEPKDLLTLKQALALALLKHPDLASYSLEVRAREARALQSGVLPNPALEIEVDNWGGNKDLGGFDGAETTIAISQLIELGGKRAKRAQVASLERDIAQWDYQSKRLDVLKEVRKSFITALAEQERLVLIEGLHRLAQQSLDITAARVEAGKVSPIDETRSSAELAKVEIELERSRTSLESARKRLAISCGLPVSFFGKVDGELALSPSMPSFDSFALLLARNPDLARWSSETEQRQAALNLEHANRLPDPSVRAGMKRFSANSETAFVAGLSLPLPLFNRNSGAVAEAEHRLAKAGEDQRSVRLRAEAALADAYQALSSSFAEARALKEEVLPALQSAYNAVQEGYRNGKFGQIDLLDAQRALFEARNRYVDALAAFGRARADTERLTSAGMRTPVGSTDEQ